MASLKKLVEKAREHLDRDEQVLVAIPGTYETKIMGSDSLRSGAFIATDRRVVFYASKMFGYDFEVFPYGTISSIEAGKNFMGRHITLYASGNKAHLKWISEGNVAAFTEEVRNRIGKKEAAASAAPATESIPDQIRKLGELREAGIITDEEFSEKKREMLARM